jgi:hypothetical protein
LRLMANKSEKGKERTRHSVALCIAPRWAMISIHRSVSKR